MPDRAPAKAYDRRYFDRWYRHPRHRVRTPAQLARRVALAVAVAEYFLERPLRSVLDVGCGEGAWQPVLRRLRPRLRYTGVDPSRYAVARYGARRNLRLGTLARLDEAVPPAPFDLVLCSDVMHYLSEAEVEAGLELLGLYTGCLLYLPVFTREDDISGDCAGFHQRSAEFYRAALQRAGFLPCGLHCYLPLAWSDALAALERSPRPAKGAPSVNLAPAPKAPRSA